MRGSTITCGTIRRADALTRRAHPCKFALCWRYFTGAHGPQRGAHRAGSIWPGACRLCSGHQPRVSHPDKRLLGL